MSVIIRLQNLPWNANALDIRRFFQGLAIPDGGVHIIGGDNGDAFIAFSTDEDARQAMMKAGGVINGFPVKLLLSSKTEMQNIIASAKGGGPPPPQPQQPQGLPVPGVGVAKPGGFFERNVVAPPVGAPPATYIPGISGVDVSGSGQGLRSSAFQTGVGTLPPNVPPPHPQPQPQQYGYPMPTNQPQMMVAPAEPQRPVMNAPAPAMAPVFNQPPPDNRQPPQQQPVIGNFRPLDRPNVQPNPAPVMQLQAAPVNANTAIPGLQSATWGSAQPVAPREVPQANLTRPLEMQGNLQTGSGFNSTFSQPAVGQPIGQGPAVGNFNTNPQAGKSFGATMPDMGRDLGRMDNSRQFDQRENQGLDNSRYMGMSDRSRWSERDVGNQNVPGSGFSTTGRPFSGRDVDPGREFQKRDNSERGFLSLDRWMENRSNTGGLGQDRNAPVTGDRFERGGRPFFQEDSRSRFGTGPGGRGTDMGGGLDRDRDRRPLDEPGYRESPRPLVTNLLQPPPPAQQWRDGPRDSGPPSRFDSGPPSRFGDSRPLSPPQDRFLARPGMPPRDDRFGGRGDFDPRAMRDERALHDCCVRAENFPPAAKYFQIRQFFKDSEIPRDAVKLTCDRIGVRTGIAYIRFADMHSMIAAIDMNGAMLHGSRIHIERCSDEEYDRARDGLPGRRLDRSRSPMNRRRGDDDDNSSVVYFVLKKLPKKADKSDVVKFLGSFKIMPDGGPFFELAHDKIPTGNVLVAIQKEKDMRGVYALHRKPIHGSPIDVIKITSVEFENRSKTAKPEKDGGNNSNTAAGKPTPKNVEEKQEGKAKEVEKASETASKEQPKGGDSGADRRDFCVELLGLPFSASTAKLQEFFQGMNVPADCIHIVYNREGKASGVAFAEFATLGEQKRALEFDKKYIGHRFIRLKSLTRAAMIKEYNYNQKLCGGNPMVEKPQNGRGDSLPGTEVLLSMQNLHFDTQLEDILEFFGGFHPIVDSIKLQYKDGQPTGDGLVGFKSTQEAEAAIRTKNRHMLLGKPITLSWPKK